MSVQAVVLDVCKDCGVGCLYRLWCWMSVETVVLDVCKDYVVGCL